MFVDQCLYMNPFSIIRTDHDPLDIRRLFNNFLGYGGTEISQISLKMHSWFEDEQKPYGFETM